MRINPAVLFLPMFLLALSACTANIKKEEYSPVNNKESLLQADRSFSELSAQKGMKAAFLEYIDSNGVLLRNDEIPIAGADAVDYLIAINDTAYTVTREPKSAEVAASGEMGYTYGLYKLRPKIKDTVFYGSYVTVWEKTSAGKWKFVLDSMHDGIGNEEQ